MLRTTSTLVALLLALVGVGLTAAPSQADTEWSVGPATAAGPDERISLRHVVDPGASVSDHIAVTNLGSEPAAFTVVAGDGLLGDNGAFDIATGEPADSGGWITIGGLAEGGTVAVAAGETRVLPVTIDVPADATPGDHPAGIAVALSAGGDDVTVTHRVGVRLHLQVAGEIEPALSVDVTDTDYSSSWIPFAPGTLTVRYEIENTGNARVGAGTRVEASGLFGLGSTEELVTVDELLPGDSATGVVELDAWPTLYLSGSVEAAGLVVGEDQVTAPGATTADFRGLAIPWTGLLLLALLAAALTYRTRTRNRPTPTDVPLARDLVTSRE
ncbi:DUF916 domain-containing protein [Aeromicrobium sp. Leaf350]|uniref:DUF916 domain-containing protein n=1 Tax=Aeromicrobium sp. Leaf350 TaxID=2876565 RepID=UPI001E3DAA53|nr:DUF916 domain-containing protein [Aeromicrobium sp. Leaf350]